MRLVLILAAIVGVSGCMQGAGPAGEGGVPKSDGVARKLAKGVSPSEAEVALGPDSGFERNPSNWDEACVSYNYGSAEAPRYVHAVFVNDALTRATDGHLDICSFGA
ncbi:hypothetical protein TRP8649_04301 [Pelagimonas phthalicica]|uniref:Lipoprotein n=1 Tax=Pelagimonas phthalicica TaxID=1037362 RepID=A0A238JHM1_9RHOB|nr:hypothetical protein [Pelagimonas phthalicica]TDS89993.1 hypothetical protein CLV87_4048 [Pelagimonas phthalicica]SMX30160.1 hypothetical protein TRP8649_04301 [Pelagimonas phthalicica]